MTIPATIPVAAPTPTTFAQQGPLGSVLWWCRGPEPVQFQLNGCSYTAQAKGDIVQPAYCSAQDVFNISVGEDQNFDYSAASTAIWLRVAAAKINEYLGQRFDVPLQIWSDTVVWANSELCYIGITRKRGINSEALMADFRAREDAVTSWLKSARDHEITPLKALSTLDLPRQALRYLAQPARGWDRESYGVAYNTQANGFGGSGSIGLPTRRGY